MRSAANSHRRLPCFLSEVKVILVFHLVSTVWFAVLVGLEIPFLCDLACSLFPDLNNRSIGSIREPHKSPSDPAWCNFLRLSSLVIPIVHNGSEYQKL